MDTTTISPAPAPAPAAPESKRHERFRIFRNDTRNILNTLVLIGSIVVIVSLSLEVFHDSAQVYYHLYMQVQLWVCIVFLIDFFYRFYLSRRKGRYLVSNFIFFLVAIPYLNIIDYFDIEVSEEVYYVLRLMPLVRGGYGLAIMVGWITRNRITSLMVSYILIILSLTYFASLVFFTLEHPVNPAVKSYGDALWWAFMNVTTVGSNIFAKTATGEVLSVVLAASGMMLFPIFTVFITNRFQAQKQREGGEEAPADNG